MLTQKKFLKFICSISIVFFIIIITPFCVNHHHSRPSPILSINESNLIEDALLNISTCTPKDRVRQRALLTTLQTWNYLSQKFHIRYWIGYGTLVGYVQRRGLLPHDSDLDIIIMAQDTVQLVTLTDSLSHENLSWFDSNLYKVLVHPQWFIVGWKTRSYYPSEGIHFIAPNARFVNQEESIHVDIWPIYNFNPDQSQNSLNKIAMLTEYDIDYKWKSNPKNWTFPLRSCHLSGIKVWCPAEPEKLVCAIYKETALYKSDTICINGSWVYLKTF